MKKVLIISPHFPPTNSADMQRIRMSLPYFKDYNWEAQVVTVEEIYVDMVKDELLLDSVPNYIKIHKVPAFSKKWTRKIGLGSLALRSMWFYKNKVNQILSTENFDLIYFSTTEFPLCILGAYWKRKFNIPYVIDMQDPWHNEYYNNKPKSQRPKKHWFSYRLHKILEPIAMKKVGGIISVSKKYIDVLKQRYAHINNIPSEVITFGANDLDFKIAEKRAEEFQLKYKKAENFINLVYVGRGGFDMQYALKILFKAFKTGLTLNFELFNKIRFYFIGTSYAPKNKGIPTISPIAKELNVEKYVSESTDRIGFYESLHQLKNADGLIILGSNDIGYTASKLYPYIMAKKHLLGIFNNQSSAAHIMKDCDAGNLITFNLDKKAIYNQLLNYLLKINEQQPVEINFEKFEPYTAKYMTKIQVKLFNEVIKN